MNPNLMTFIESAKLSALRALILYVPCTRHTLLPHVPRVLRALYPTFLVPYVLLSLTCLVPQCFRVSLVLRALLPHMSCVISGCSCLEVYVPLCCAFLTCFKCFKPNMLLCISCLVAFLPCASCAFGTLATRAFYSLG